MANIAFEDTRGRSDTPDRRQPRRPGRAGPTKRVDEAAGRLTVGDDNPSGAVTYRWTCPLCQRSRMGIAGPDENWQVKAVGSLRTHIEGHVDETHGPPRSLPAGVQPDDLVAFVEILDGR